MVAGDVDDLAVGEGLAGPVQAFQVAVDIAGQHHHVGLDLWQLASSVEMFVVEVGQQADLHGTARRWTRRTSIAPPSPGLKADND